MKLREGDRCGDVQILGGGAHGSGDKARLCGCGELVRDLPRDLGRGVIDLVGAILELKFRQNEPRPAERIGFDDVGAGFQIGAMDSSDDIRPCNIRISGQFSLPR